MFKLKKTFDLDYVRTNVEVMWIFLMSWLINNLAQHLTSFARVALFLMISTSLSILTFNLISSLIVNKIKSKNCFDETISSIANFEIDIMRIIVIWFNCFVQSLKIFLISRLRSNSCSFSFARSHQSCEFYRNTMLIIWLTLREN